MQPKLKKLVLSFAVAFVVAILALPLVIGYWIKYEYDQLIAFYNSQGNFHIDITQYERSWFSAVATLKVSVSHPWVSRLSQRLATQNIEFPETLNFIVDQHIQYGPILYRSDSDKSLAVELAYMYSSIHFAPELAKVIQPINSYESTILIIDNLSFSGKFHRNFRSSGVRMIFPDATNKLEIRNINANMSVWPRDKRIKADIITGDFIFLSKDIDIAVPNAEIVCDRKLSHHHLWVGTSGIKLPKVYLQGSDKSSVSLYELATSGDLTESGKMLGATQQFSIGQIQASNQLIGPISLRVSIHDMDAAVTAQLISSYGQMLFSDQGMMAAAQLLVALPGIVNPTSSIKIEEFKATTPNGTMLFSGDVTWPGLSANGDRSLSETIQQTHAQGNLLMGVPLARSIMHVMADLSNNETAAVTPPQSNDARQKLLAPMQHQNELYISMLKENHQLTENGAQKLLASQQAHDSMPVYQSVLDSLMMNKEITPAVAATLKAKYYDMQTVMMAPDARREQVEKLYEKQLEQWVKDNLIVHEKDDYKTTFTYQDGKISVNGQEVASVF